tara:strand:+ start:1673 stop:1783 length:111 start_codon:yes stop_codon:yes gene_type:complete
MNKLVNKAACIAGFVVVYHISYAVFTIIFEMAGAAS